MVMLDLGLFLFFSFLLVPPKAQVLDVVWFEEGEICELRLRQQWLTCMQFALLWPISSKSIKIPVTISQPSKVEEEALLLVVAISFLDKHQTVIRKQSQNKMVFLATKQHLILPVISFTFSLYWLRSFVLSLQLELKKVRRNGNINCSSAF